MKFVVLDRDGVINKDSPDYIKSEDEWLPIPGSIDAIARLHRSGYTVAVATNQSGLARNLFSELDLAAMHYKFCSMVEEAGGAVDAIFYCPHLPTDDCDCRKPGTGLLKQMEAEFGSSLAGSYFIGDSLKDLQAALAYSMLPVLVRTGKGSDTEASLVENGLLDIPVFDDLATAVDQLVLA